MPSNFESMYLRDLNNPEHLRLQKRVEERLEEAHIPELDVFLPTYRNTIVAEDLSMQKIKGNSKTERLRVKDTERDSVFRGGGLIIEAHIHHWDPICSQAAKDLQIIHNNYRTITRHNYQKESEDIIGYLQEMGDIYSQPSNSPAGGTGGMTGGGTGSGMTGGGTGSGMTGGSNYLPAVQALNLGPWLDKLREVNNEFISIYNEREEDTNASILLSEARKTRQATDKAYHTCLSIIDMLVMANGYAPYEQLIVAINTMIRQWKAEIHRRQSQGESDEDDNTSTNTGTNTNEGGSDNTGEENGGDNNGENGGENANTDNGDPNQGEDNTPSANA